MVRLHVPAERLANGVRYSTRQRGIGQLAIGGLTGLRDLGAQAASQLGLDRRRRAGRGSCRTF